MSDDRVRDRSPIDRKDDRRRGGGGADRRKSGGRGNPRRAPPERRIFISNIPFEMKWQEVKDMFREQVGEVTYVELFNDENDKPRGCGILEFESEEYAKKAVEKMHRHELKGRKLVVKEDFDTERDKFGKIVSGRGGRDRDRDRDRGDRDRAGSSGGGGASNSGLFGNNTYGLSPQFLDSLGIDGPLHSRLFVANLAYGVDEKKLREVFRLAGRVVTAELNRDKEGKSRGHAVVEYDHPVEAVQAISMFNNQSLYERKITVRFDKQPGPSQEELNQLPSRLPEGLAGVGMGLGSGGNPLTDVAKNLPSSQNAQSGGSGSQMQMGNQMGNANGMDAGGGGGGSGGGSATNSVSQGLSELSALAAFARQLGNNIGGMGGLAGLGGLGGGANAGNAGGGMGGGPAQRNMPGGNSMGMPGGSGGVNMNSGGGMGVGSNPSGMGMPGGMMGGGSGSQGGGSGSQGGMGGGSSGSMSDIPRNPGGYSTSTAGGYSIGSGGSGGGGGGSGGGGSGSGHGDMGDVIGSNRGMSMRSDTIMIRNLPPDCNWQILREGFAHCGDIKYAEMKDRGTGMIRFNNDRDSERAVSMMNNQSINGRTIDVRLY